MAFSWIFITWRSARSDLALNGLSGEVAGFDVASVMFALEYMRAKYRPMWMKFEIDCNVNYNYFFVCLVCECFEKAHLETIVLCLSGWCATQADNCADIEPPIIWFAEDAFIAFLLGTGQGPDSRHFATGRPIPFMQTMPTCFFCLCTSSLESDYCRGRIILTNRFWARPWTRIHLLYKDPTGDQ